MSSKYVLRFDDIAPSMAWSKFSAFENLACELDVPFLVGVVPNCTDRKLSVEFPLQNFWDVIRDWNARGWTIAQHGYTHQCATRNRDLLAIGEKTEFAGLPYDEQLASLRAGKDVLTSQGVWQPVFMAPSHSFDQITLLALSDLGFRYLTDGYGVYPYRMGKLTAVPQLFASPLNFGFGIYSICLHVNTMTKTQIAHIMSFVHAHRKQIISFEEAASMRCCVPWVAPTSRLLTSAALKTVRAIRKRR